MKMSLNKNTVAVTECLVCNSAFYFLDDLKDKCRKIL